MLYPLKIYFMSCSECHMSVQVFTGWQYAVQLVLKAVQLSQIPCLWLFHSFTLCVCVCVSSWVWLPPTSPNNFWKPWFLQTVLPLTSCEHSVEPCSVYLFASTPPTFLLSVINNCYCAVFGQLPRCSDSPYLLNVTLTFNHSFSPILAVTIKYWNDPQGEGGQ